MSPLLAQPINGTVIVARPLSELKAYLSHGRIPNWELVSRVIKTVVCSIFRGHLCDHLALAHNGKIYHSFRGKVVAKTCEEIQKEYPHLLETASVLIPRNPIDHKPHFVDRVDSSSLGNYFFSNSSYTTKDLLGSLVFQKKAFIDTPAGPADIERKIKYMAAYGTPQQFDEFNKLYPKALQNDLIQEFFLTMALIHGNVNLLCYFSSLKSEIMRLSPFWGSIKTIENLVNNNFPTNAIDSEGYNMLHYAALSGRKEVVELVLTWDYLKGHNNDDSHSRVPEVFWAAKSGKVDCLQYLKSVKGDSFQIQHSSEGSILHYGVQSKKPEMVKFLVEHQAVLLHSNMWREYPIHIAASRCGLEMVEFLWPLCKQAGMKIDDLPNHGTLLFRAVKKGKSLPLVKYLVKQGASIRTVNCDGKNALSLVTEPKYPNPEIKQYILSLS